MRLQKAETRPHRQGSLENAETRPHRRISREVWRFLKGQLASGIATSVDWGLMTILILSGVYYITAAVIGAVAGAITDFSVKKWWVFDAAKRERVEVQVARRRGRNEARPASVGCWSVTRAHADRQRGAGRRVGRPLDGVPIHR